MKKNSSALLLLATALASLPAYCEPAPTYNLNLSRLPIRTALQEISKSTGVQVGLFLTHKDENVFVGPILGSYTVEAALSHLLANTDYRYKRVNESTIAVISKEPTVEAGSRSALSQRQPISLSFVSVRSEEESARTVNLSSTEDHEEVLVTGSHIRGVTPVSPIIAITNADIEKAGYGSIADVVRSLPQNFSGGFNGAQGYIAPTPDSADNVDYSYSPNLRGLGPGSTLVLINGHRLAPSGISNAVDISVIPLAVIERVDVLTDGASALYGSDAVAGVMNFIIKDDVQGAETGLQFGGSSRGGAGATRVSQFLGTEWDSGSVLLAYEYGKRDPLPSRKRSFSEDVLDPTYLLPEQSRDSYFAHVSQEIVAGTSLFIDALYSSDSVNNKNSGNPPLEIDDRFNKELVSTTVGVDFALPGAWGASIYGNFGKSEQEQRTFYPSFSFNSETNYQNEAISGGAKIDGSVGNIKGRPISVALGAEGRQEQFSTDLFGSPSTFSRNVRSVFSELNVPLLVGDGGREIVRLDAAARWERYERSGASTNPKVAVAWDPSSAVRIRGSWGKAFQAPTLYYLYAPIYAGIQEVSDPDSSSGQSLAFIVNGGNPELRSQTARTWTVGVDWQPDAAPALKLSLTYFRTNFKNRIQVLEQDFNSYLPNEAFDSAAIVRDPSETLLQSYVERSTLFLNPDNIALSDVAAFINASNLNVAQSHVDGLDFVAKYSNDTSFGVFDYGLNVAYQLKNARRTTESSPELSQLDKLFLPTAFRARGSISWSKGIIDASAFVNFSDGYSNQTVTPQEAVGSYTTIDWQWGVNFGELSEGGVLENLRATLSIQNLLDEEPPFIRSTAFQGAAPYGYDPANANPIGRFITVQLTKGW